jgi:hypothetical protein
VPPSKSGVNTKRYLKRSKRKRSPYARIMPGR